MPCQSCITHHTVSTQHAVSAMALAAELKLSQKLAAVWPTQLQDDHSTLHELQTCVCIC